MGIPRRGSRWLGYFIVVMVLGLFASLGVGTLTLDTVLLYGLLLLTGVLFVLAGFETPLTRRFGWHRILGLGFFGGSSIQLTNGLFFRVGDGGLLYLGVTLLLAVLFAFMGFDIARGGPHFAVDPEETV